MWFPGEDRTHCLLRATAVRTLRGEGQSVAVLTATNIVGKIDTVEPWCTWFPFSLLGWPCHCWFSLLCKVGLWSHRSWAIFFLTNHPSQRVASHTISSWHFLCRGPLGKGPKELKQQCLSFAPMQPHYEAADCTKSCVFDFRGGLCQKSMPWHSCCFVKLLITSCKYLVFLCPATHHYKYRNINMFSLQLWWGVLPHTWPHDDI